MATNIEDKVFPTVVQLLASEYASYFLGGFENISRKTQDRLNAIDDKKDELGVSFEDWRDLVMAHFGKLEGK